jgi:hypothetical protein
VREREEGVPEPLRVEAPSEDLAQALRSRLQAFPTELETEDGRVEVRVALVGNADRAIVDVLDGVDGWLVEHGLESVRVFLDDRTYTLTPPTRNGR